MPVGLCWDQQDTTVFDARHSQIITIRSRVVTMAAITNAPLDVFDHLVVLHAI
jgi:hypothetical protein